MMRSRWLFFTLFSSFAMPGRFLPIFYHHHGLFPSQIGLLLSLPSALSLFSVPFFCHLADRLHRRELVAGSTYSLALLLFSLQAITLPSLNILPESARFPFLLTLRTVFGVLAAPAGAIICAIAVAQLKNEYGDQGHQRFGQERLWGAVAWATCSFALGAVLDAPDVGIWVVYVGFGVSTAAFVFVLERFAREQGDQSNFEEKDIKQNKEGSDDLCPSGNGSNTSDSVGSKNSRSLLSAARLILSSGGFATALFFLLLFCLHAGMSLVENLIFLYFQADLGASNLLCGLSVVVTVIFEVPLFAAAPYLLKRFGAPALAVLGSLAYVIRGFGYTVVPNGWVVLLLEPLHGVTYAASTAAAVAYVADRTPTRFEATGQAVLDVVQALGYAVGTAVEGVVMEEFGNEVLYRGAALIVLVATTAFAVGNKLSTAMENRVHTATEGGPARWAEDGVAERDVEGQVLLVEVTN